MKLADVRFKAGVCFSDSRVPPMIWNPQGLSHGRRGIVGYIWKDSGLALDDQVYRFEDVRFDNGYMHGYCFKLSRDPIFIFPGMYKVETLFVEPFYVGRCSKHKHTPLRCILDVCYREDVAEARRRVAMKRYLRRNGCPMHPETPSHILRNVTRQVRRLRAS